MIIRKANLSDSINLFTWRNDPSTRSASLDTSIVDWGEHQEWLAAVVENPNVAIFMVEEDAASNSAIGMCRFILDSGTNKAEVSINLNPQFRGKGFGRKILNGCIEAFFLQYPHISSLTAKIREENIASLKTFRGENFIPLETIEGIVYHELKANS